jgi:two-component system sensor histidine kinase/response regulator
LVDDNQTNLDITKEILELAGLEVETALSGHAALRILDRSEQVNQAFDLIILDINMPMIDGFQTLCQIRKRPAWEKIPVIALTADGAETDIAKTHAAGFYSHLVKPVNPSSLHEIIYRATKTPSLQLTDTAIVTPLNSVSMKENQFLALTNAGFDVDLALNRMRRRTKTYRRLISGFYDDYSSLLQTSSNEYKSTNLEEWTRTIHSIKGLSGMMGATSLMEACAAYELALKGGDTSHASFANFSDELTRALCTIKKFLEEYPSENNLGSPE